MSDKANKTNNVSETSSTGKTSNSGNAFGLMIATLAVFCVYLLLTIAVAVGFEYYTVTKSHGEVIFSVLMSWQMLLFTAEAVTIIIQMIALILMLKNVSEKRFRMFSISGIVAGAISLICVIVLMVTDGLVVNPTCVFLAYALIIITVRSILLPKLIKRKCNPLQVV